ncbi:MAG: hypothetical protein AB7P69_10065 [Candidatus Binatia bacterium]
MAVTTLVVIIGYGIIAVPTGIVTVEISEAVRKRVSTRACSAEGHDGNAVYCKYCGTRL